MPRKARINAPGALHHTVICGIERKPIFRRQEDYDNFLDHMGNILMDLRESDRRAISDEQILGSSECAETVLRAAREAHAKQH